jgi:hypothetical protein
MTILCVAALAALVASASPLPATPAQYTPPHDGAQIVCTEQYAPVCGRIDNVMRTFSNACYARAAGAEIVAPGPCGDVPARPLAR